MTCIFCITVIDCPQSQAEKLRKQGNLAFDQEDYPAAAEAYSNAITIEPTNPAHYLNRATLYFVLQQFEDALTDAEHASFLTPDMWKVNLLTYLFVCLFCSFASY